jgi:hypothetical protein
MPTEIMEKLRRDFEPHIPEHSKDHDQDVDNGECAKKLNPPSQRQSIGFFSLRMILCKKSLDYKKYANDYNSNPTGLYF